MAVVLNEILRKRVDEWKQRLIDLTKRNHLLSYKKTKSSTLELSEPNIDEIFKSICVDNNPYGFWLPPNIIPDEDEEAVAVDGDDDSADIDLLGTIFDEDKEGKLVSGNLERKTISNTLRNLFRKEREEYRERGIRVLFLSFGMLEWQEDGATDSVYKSPLLLFPVELRRESANDPFVLYPVDEDLVLNPALQVKMRRDFNWELPDLPEDLEDFSVSDYMANVTDMTRAREWVVDSVVTLRIFTFEKLGMYQDLEKNFNILAGHACVKALCGDSLPGCDLSEIKDERKLDRIQKPEDTYQILDADSSQQQAIQAVLKGQSLVLQGPPGTGKSQTIANIISEFIARGRTVLFVSEKMAALEVVAKRLKEANLGTYCLELHSRKKNKKEVVEDLYSCMEHRLEPQKNLTKEDFATLTTRRNKLNDYVNALHSYRPELGRTARQALSAASDDVDALEMNVNRLSELTFTRAQAMEDAARSLLLVWHVALEGKAFPWRGCTEQEFSSFIERKWMSLLTETKEACNDLKAMKDTVVEATGLKVADGLDDCKWLVDILSHIEGRPLPHESWITATHLDDLLEKAKKYGDLSADYWSQHTNLVTKYDYSFFQIPAEIHRKLNSAWHDAEDKIISEAGGKSLLAGHQRLAEILAEFRTVLFNFESNAKILAETFGYEIAPLSIASAEHLILLRELCARERRPEEMWLNRDGLDIARQFVSENQHNYEKHSRLKAKLLEKYEESYLELDHTELALRFSGILYKSPLRWLNPGWYSARNEIIVQTRDLQCPKNIVADLTTARKLVKLMQKLNTIEPTAKTTLGTYFKGENTDFSAICQGLDVAEETIVAAGGIIPRGLAVCSKVGGRVPEEADKACTKLIGYISALLDLKEKLNEFIDTEEMKPLQRPFWQCSTSALREWIDQLTDALQRFAEALAFIRPAVPGSIPKSIDEILTDLLSKYSLDAVVESMAFEEKNLKAYYGERFHGLETKWEDVMAAIKWTQGINRLLAGKEVSDILTTFLLSDKNAPYTAIEFSAVYSRTEKAIKQIEENFEYGLPDHSGLPLRHCQLGEITAKAALLSNRVKDLEDWVDYRKAFGRFRAASPERFPDKLVAARPSKENLIRTLKKSIAAEQARLLIASDPALNEFKGISHEQLVADFRMIDKKLIELAPSTVIKLCNSRRPMVNGFDAQGSETVMLKREAKKSRRLMPLVNLFERIPNLLLKLKPCLMMSPLSVSQYINPERFHFDLVIFDEASQIFTEDAIVAIYRGKQVVIAGDSKQMPPTNFFKALDDIPEDDESEEELSSASYSSVLDECESFMNQFSLRWHYRSRHESLIAYSNSSFYGGKLVTFPSPIADHKDHGVRFAHVPDGIYDRGGRRCNIREAEVVADKVFEHFSAKPGKSLGVVAFSRQQADAIEDAIEKRRSMDSSFEGFFSDDRLEGFFVKSLENVQGDERDVMIFSIGYGRDQNNKISMNFGPLNKDGGERRLNVAITRARENVLVVSSIRAGDFTLTEEPKPGVLNLYRYLDFAERGAVALEITHPEGIGEMESPLEESIAAVILQLGYTVIPQVGCSGYRIDLGVLHPSEPGKFILGVECDGATYHSGKTARDRDRLRHQILVKLGWRIHHIWSQDWYHHRDRQIEKLKQVLAEAIKENPPSLRTESQSTKPVLISIKKVPIKEPSRLTAQQLQGTREYKCCNLVGQAGSLEFHDPHNINRLAWMSRKIVDTEGPVHVDIVARRLADAYSLTKIGDRMRKAVYKAISGAINGGTIRLNGQFLWTKEQVEVIPRFPGRSSESRRDMEHIAPEEIQAAMMLIIKQCVGITIDGLLGETAKMFGNQRLTPRIKDHLVEIATRMEENGTIILNGDSVILNVSKNYM